MKVGTEHIVPFLSGHRCDLTVIACTKYFQTSYLSQISQIISMEKNLSLEEFQISVKNLKNLWSFIEIYAVFVLNLCGEKSVWRKNDKYEVF